MTRVQRRQRRNRIHSWKSARPLGDRRRKDLKTLTVAHKQPRVIDTVRIDFVSGESIEREGKGNNIARTAHYERRADVRRPSGAILVIDRYEVMSVSDGKTRLEPRLRALDLLARIVAG
jgi:hypothetical protein